MFSTRREYIQELNKLHEKAFPKIKKLWGFNPWFIIQIQIGYYFHLIFNQKTDFEYYKTLPPKLSKSVSLRDLYRLIVYKYRLQKLKYRIKNAFAGKTLLIGYKRHNKSDVYNIYLHSYIDSFLNGDSSNCTFLYLDQPFENNDILQNYYTLLVTYKALLFDFNNTLNPFSLKNNQANAELISNHLTHLEFIDTNITEVLVFNNTKENQLYYTIFKSLFKNTAPDKVWLYCYYDNRVSALLRASNKLNIPTNEYQHSAISDNHFAYTHWPHVDFYSSFFPQTFNVWNEIDRNLVLKNFQTNNYRPNIEVVGNLFLNIQRKELKQHTKEERKNKILICLQGQWVPEFIEKAISEDSSHEWYIRLHPRYPEDKAKLIAFKSKYPEKIKVDEANNTGLYQLLESVSALLTAFSGTALEAYELNVKVVIFGEEGYLSYENYIKEGAFAFVKNEHELLQSIK